MSCALSPILPHLTTGNRREKCERSCVSSKPKAVVVRVELDEELRSGFFVRYDNGQTAEVSWAFIRELPPKR